MGGYSQGFDDSAVPPDIAGLLRKKLAPALMGAQPAPQASPAGSRLADRINDDPRQTQVPESGTEDLENQIAQSRKPLAEAMQQGAGDEATADLESRISPPDLSGRQPSDTDRMQQQYDTLGQRLDAPPPKHSLLKDMLGGALAGPQAGAAFQRRQQGEEFQQNQVRERQQSLGQQIEAQRRMEEQERAQNERERMAQQAQTEREKYQTDSQGRLFRQQSDMLATRDLDRQTQEQASRQASDDRLSKTIQASDDRQSRSEAHQERMIPLRQKTEKATADEQRRADLGNNMTENLDQLEDIATRRPELFGKIGGRKTAIQQNDSPWNPFAGTTDKDVAKLKAIKEYLGMASVGAHSMRNAQHVGEAANAVMAGFLNSPEATKAAIQSARQSVATFMQDVQDPGRAGRGTPNLPSTGGAALKDRVAGKILVEGRDF